ncbi:MAG TPA: GYF domain-containing protein [Opitutaceae bacterium]|nr:GYF domain-containing protein [Opitutaceae bacterium]HRJ47162.1 GYF domain-containing protein [Opitutaceae bacterium]
MATQEFYIRNESETEARGPFSLEQLSSLLDSGQITTGTLYYEAATEQWATIESNAEMKAVLFPEKKRLKVKAKENLTTLNTSSDSRPPITVDEMLAAAEGHTDETKDRKDPAIAMARAAGIGMYGAMGMLLIAAAGELLPSVDFLMAFNLEQLPAHPLVLLGVLDLALGLLLGLGMVNIYPFVRFRAALGLGFLGFIFYTQGQGLPLVAVLAGSAGLYLSTVSVSLLPVVLAVGIGLLGMLGVTHAMLTR